MTGPRWIVGVVCMCAAVIVASAVGAVPGCAASAAQAGDGDPADGSVAGCPPLVPQAFREQGRTAAEALAAELELVAAFKAEARPEMDGLLNWIGWTYRTEGLEAALAAAPVPIPEAQAVAMVVYTAGPDATRDVAAALRALGVPPRIVGEGYIDANVPVAFMDTVAALPGVTYMRAVVPARPVGPATQAAVQAGSTDPNDARKPHRVDPWHAAGFEGQGMKIGILDLGFAGYQAAVAQGHVPPVAGVRCYDRSYFQAKNTSNQAKNTSNPPPPFGDSPAACRPAWQAVTHGTVVTEAAFAIAPEADYYLASANGPANREAVEWMIKEGVKVINVSKGFRWDGPGDGNSPFPDSFLNTIKHAVDEKGVVVVVANGNTAEYTWYGPPVPIPMPASEPGSIWHSFQPANSDPQEATCNDVEVQQGQNLAVQLRWDDSWQGARMDLDLLIFEDSAAVNAGGGTPGPVVTVQSSPQPTATPTPQPVTNIATTNLRREPDTDSDIVDTLPADSPVRPVARNHDGTWLWLDTRAWIWAPLVKHVPTGLPVVDSNGLPVAAPARYQLRKWGAMPQLGRQGDRPREWVYWPNAPAGTYCIRVLNASAMENRPVSAPGWFQLNVFSGQGLAESTDFHHIGNPAESASPGMLAVGAVEYSQNSALAWYSSRGPAVDGRRKPELAGVAGVHSHITGGPADGTSFAAPRVAALAALVLQANPLQAQNGMSPAQVATYLKDHADPRPAPDPWSSPDPNNSFGHGLAVLPPPPVSVAVLPPPPSPQPSFACCMDLACDKQVLLNIRDELRGSNTSALTNWKESTPVEDFDGIGVGGTPRRVTAFKSSPYDSILLLQSRRGSTWEMRLPDENIVSKRVVPSPLTQLTHLNTGSSFGNEFVGITASGQTPDGTIPAELGKLCELRELGWLRLSGQIPSQLGQLQNLEVLDFNNVWLSGSIPSELGQLQNLKRLDLWNNYLTGRIPSELGQLQNLEYLDLGSNELTGSIPSELGQLQNLEKLVLWGNQLTGCVPRNLEQAYDDHQHGGPPLCG